MSKHLVTHQAKIRSQAGYKAAKTRATNKLKSTAALSMKEVKDYLKMVDKMTGKEAKASLITLVLMAAEDAIKV